MLRHIIKKEILEIISTPKLVFAFVICTVLVLIAMHAGLSNYRLELREYETAVAANRRNLQSIREWGQLMVTGGEKITRPPQVLNFLINGTQSSAGREATVTAYNNPVLTRSRCNSNPIIAVFGRLDLTFAVRVVFSLLAIIFSFNAFSGEKEQGTLKLILAHPVPRTSLLLGKALGGFICLVCSLAVPLIISLILISLYPEIILSGEDRLRIGLIVAFYLLYIAAFYVMGLFVSSRFGNSSLSLLATLLAWVLFVAVIPQASVKVSGIIHPAPSTQVLASRKSDYTRQMQATEQPALEEWQRNNPPPGGNIWDKAWAEKSRAFRTSFIDRMNNNIYGYHAALDAEFQSHIRSQQRFAVRMSRISPASCLMFGAMTLGRTGIPENERLINSIKSYRAVFADWGYKKMLARSRENTPMEDWNKPVLSDKPEFTFEPESMKDSAMAALPDFSSLIFIFLLLFAGAYVSFLRYDVR